MEAGVDHPSWDRLFEIAGAQEGLFTTQQAAQAGYSPQLLNHFVRRGRVMRLRRGVYRLVHFPAGEHEDLVLAWLQSESAGVVSHQTALSLHGLSDVLAPQIHLTLPAAWRTRRFRLAEGVRLHFADIPPEQRAWFGPVPITTAQRTLDDCAREDLSPEQLVTASLQALRRGLVTRAELGGVEAALAAFGGLPA